MASLGQYCNYNYFYYYFYNHKEENVIINDEVDYRYCVDKLIDF